MAEKSFIDKILEAKGRAADQRQKERSRQLVTGEKPPTRTLGGAARVGASAAVHGARTLSKIPSKVASAASSDLLRMLDFKRNVRAKSKATDILGGFGGGLGTGAYRYTDERHRLDAIAKDKLRRRQGNK